MEKDTTTYVYLLRRDNAEAYTKRLVRQLERLGHKVSLEPLPLSA